MIRFEHLIDVALYVVLRMQSLVCSTGLRYGSVVMTLPLLSSVCFFAFRFALSQIGAAV